MLLKEWVAQLPKVELHIHLEGAVPLDDLWTLYRSRHSHSDLTLGEFTEKFAYTDFGHFLEMWNWMNSFVTRIDDFSFMAESFANYLVDQRVVYAEAFFSPSDFRGTGLGADEIAVALRQGLDRVPGTRVALIADMVRGRSNEAMQTTLDQVTDVRDDAGVIGIGLGGNEGRFPASLHADIWAEAAKRGFQTTAHAGEAGGPGSVTDAIERLNVTRVGHGVQAVDDPAVLAYVAEHQIALEVCPWSNVRTKVVDSIADHPIRRLFDAGALVTLNSDDPAFFDTSLSAEYATLHEQFGFSESEILTVAKNAVTASWADERFKTQLHSMIDNYAATYGIGGL